LAVSFGKCPKCGSSKVSVTEKEIHTAWRLGLSTPLIFERNWGTKETFKEYVCGNCGNKFRFLPSTGESSEIPEPGLPSSMMGKKVRLVAPTGQTIEAKIDDISATIRVNVGKTEVIVENQLIVTLPSLQKTFVGLTLVSDENDVPVGVLWAGGDDSQGYFHGVVTPIKLWKTGKTEENFLSANL
jgi:DNA-directed RNA polymerase subunit RPC12/RpoP